MRILFMGTAEFAVPCLRAAAANHQVITVVTQPDRPKGRGRKIQPSPVKEAALELGLDVYQPEKIKTPEVFEHLKNLVADLLVVVAYGQILPKSILELPPLGAINVHASLLPAYRGAAPIHWALINGEEETGVSTMYMVPALDSGDVILQSKVKIAPHENVGLLHDRLAEDGAALLKKTLDLIESGAAPRIPQQDSLATYASLLTREHEKIAWNKTCYQVANHIRGMNPWPGAYTTYQGKVLKILEAMPMEQETDAAPGTITSIDKNAGFVVQCGEGQLLVTAVKPQGKTTMEGAAFARGYDLQTGVTLGSAD